MHLGFIIETNDPERLWNGFRLANEALADGHEVETFLLGDGVETPDVQSEKYNPRGVVRKYLNDGGTLLACGTCLDSRSLEADELRPRATMADLLEIVTSADRVVTIG